MDIAQIKERLENELPECTAKVEGGGANFQVFVVSPVFEGLTLVKRQQKVYACFASELDSGEIHALTMKTFTPQQWQSMSAAQ